jgi:hypothetical protein
VGSSAGAGLVPITRELIALSATFMLIAAMNPYPQDYHGNHGDLKKPSGWWKASYNN